MHRERERIRAVRLWRGDGRDAGWLPGGAGAPRALEFSPDGRLLLLGAFDGTVRLLPVRTEDLLRDADERLRRDFSERELGNQGDLLSDETMSRARAAAAPGC